MDSLPSLRTGLLRHQLLDQVLVYDTEKDKLHLLDGTTATVAELLEKGATAQSIIARLEEQQRTDGGSELLTLALDELAKAELTDGGANALLLVSEVTRREMLQKFAAIGAAVLIPAVISFTPSTAYALSSVACGAACVTSSQCPPPPGKQTTCGCCAIGGPSAGLCWSGPSGNCS
jgi:hypothetical protein